MRLRSALLPLFSLISFAVPSAAFAVPCPVAARYCQAGPAEAGQKLDLAPASIQSQMKAQFLPQCKTAMIQGMGTGAKPVANAFCTCSVNAILATPGEWRVLRSVGGKNPKQVAATHKALAKQTQAQEKACMYAIAEGTGLIAPKNGTTPETVPGTMGNGLGLSGGTPLPPSSNPNFSGGMGSLLGAPYLPNGGSNGQ